MMDSKFSGANAVGDNQSDDSSNQHLLPVITNASGCNVRAIMGAALRVSRGLPITQVDELAKFVLSTMGH